jgi:hypothetical protein
VIAHAVLGCVQQASSGGQCGPGAAAAAFGKIATGLTQGLSGAAQFAVTTVVGGTVSVIGGGKFANGAAQAGFGYLFNYLSGGRDVSSPEELDQVAGPGMTLKEFALAVAPGGAAVECFAEGCGGIGWAIAAIDAVPGGGKIAGKGLKYAHSIRAKALLDPVGYNFPHSFDNMILSTKPIVQSDKTLLYVAPGHVNNKAGFYTIVVRPDTNTVIHRAFQEKYKVR